MGERRWIVLGTVLKTHGLKGEVRVGGPRDWLDRFPGLGEVTLAKGEARSVMKIESARQGGKYAFVKFAGVDGPDRAGALRGSEILIEEERLGAPREGGFHAHELLGFDVRDGDGESLGSVADVLDLPTCECLAVRTAGGSEIQVPVLGHVVKSIEKEARIIVVDRGQLAELL
jgi:16S rRNA processing protein RimM